MTETLAVDGRWREMEDGWELRFERRLRHPPERVWRALTTPEGLACWLAEAEIDPQPGGRMDLHFRQPDNRCLPDTPEARRQSNEVLAALPFSRFEHTFGGDPEAVVRWTLEPDGDGTLLTLTHHIPAAWGHALSRVLSGWHHHMEGLEDACYLIPHPWSWPRWEALRDAYQRELDR